MNVIVDLKGATLKELSSKHMQGFIKKLGKLCVDKYPELVHKIFIMNAPMFFDDIFDDLKALFPATTQKKFIVSGGSSHQ
jgi:hypothetical protein